MTSDNLIWTKEGWWDKYRRVPAPSEVEYMYYNKLEIGYPLLQYDCEIGVFIAEPRIYSFSNLAISCDGCASTDYLPRLMFKGIHPEPSWHVEPEWVLSFCIDCCDPEIYFKNGEVRSKDSSENQFLYTPNLKS